MSKIVIELEIDLGENKNEEMNSLTGALAVFLGPRVKGWKYLTSRIVDGPDEPESPPSLSYDPR